LKKLLKEYNSSKSNEILDFIIFGSTVKNTMNPGDLDIAAITNAKNAAFVGELKSKLITEIGDCHLQIISYDEFVKSKLPYFIISEGHSIKEGKFLSEMAKIKRQVLYWFELSDLVQTKKVMFNKGLNNILESTKAQRIGKGVILVEINTSGEVEDFLKLWRRKIRKKEFIEMN